MKNFIKGEFIGLPVKIGECSDPSFNGIEGIIIDETKNTFLIKTNTKEKKIAKEIAKFEINGISIEGKKIKWHPWERIKKTSA
jgi:ribonuclease P protein subunit POP4